MPLAVADIVCLERVGHTLPPHAHEQFGITLFLADGEVRRASRRAVSVRAGDVLVVPPGEVISIRAGASGRTHLETLLIAPGLLGEMFPMPDHALIRDRRIALDLVLEHAEAVLTVVFEAVVSDGIVATQEDGCTVVIVCVKIFHDPTIVCIVVDNTFVIVVQTPAEITDFEIRDTHIGNAYAVLARKCILVIVFPI